MNYKFKRNKVLIIDDSSTNVELVSAILKTYNLNTYGITDPTIAISEIEKLRPDLVLLDIVMPGISGFEICEKIKLNPELKDIPIIFLTGADDENNIIKAFELGASDYVNKPINRKELFARIETHIKLRRIKEKERLAFKELESFNHMISHDLKTPVWTINKMTSYLREYSEKINDPDFDELVDMLCKKSEDTAYLIEKYAELAKLSTMDIVIEQVDMNTLVRKVFAEINPPKKVIFNIGNLPSIKADRILMEQVFINILSNSLKFSKHKEVPTITVDCKLLKDNCIFYIEDNGVGFNKDYSNDVFEMFKRLHSKKDFEGTGTGLAIVKKIIELHDGTVWMTGEENMGATIYFALNL